jgi:hypothetical protein
VSRKPKARVVFFLSLLDQVESELVMNRIIDLMNKLAEND